MKLINCYIENFGGLSRYSLDFSEGVTMLQEPNGFGKTTLAEFLRAMFYGFPRKAKTLDKSKRQKYTPWGGGKFGGNLVFEHEGKQYRLERTFGATPRSDSFNLIDLETGKKSSRFSEDIGLELFGLDADSFERSTYLPQLHDNSTLTTTGIQAKLGDLVEDTGDINNFDKAMQALHSKRSGFIPYRGNGGTVAEAANQISRLQQELDQMEALRADLHRCAGEIGDTEAELAQKKQEIDTTRQQWEEASKAAHARQRYDELTAQHRSAVQELTALAEKYPVGIPGEPEIEGARKTADEKAVLEAQQITTQADRDALVLVETHTERFGAHVPSPEELEAAQRNCDTLAELRTMAEHIGLTGEERKQYEKLRTAFASGDLDEDALDALAEQNRLLLRQRAALENLTQSPEDQRRLQELQSKGIPTEEELYAHRQTLERCELLRRENAELEARAVAVPKNNPLLIGAAAALVLGVVLIVMQFLLPGAIIAVAGVVLGVITWTQRSKAAGELARLRERVAENEADIRFGEETVANFVRGCGCTSLEEVQRNREELLNLREKLRNLQEKREVQAELVRQTEETLRHQLGDAEDFDRAISDLRLSRGQYLDLRRKKMMADGELARLREQTELLQAELAAFFAPYYRNVPPERFAQQLTTLQRDAEAYLRAKEQVARLTEAKKKHNEEMARCRQALAAFFGKYGLLQGYDVRKRLQEIYDDGKAMRIAAAQKEKLEQQMKQFTEVPTVAADPDDLKRAEQNLTEIHTALTEKLLDQRQNQRRLRMQVDRIPELTDDLERWQERKLSHQQKARTLDDTMEFLQQARESLTTGYLGPIRESFAGYLEKLSGGQKDQAFISPELEVQLERQGQARELGYFSAGQTDVVMLCMRLALVDALFTDVKPFVILDDPFVNLDDAHTAEALELLKELGKERQIIYLTCNSSRSI